MCGIAGVIDIDNRIKLDKLSKMTSIIKHRGPDDEGFYLWSKSQEGYYHGHDSVNEIKKKIPRHILSETEFKATLGLGHRRLSIIDISSNGHQPMEMEEFVLVFNGEIYNYIELKEELIELGYKFNTSSDTEVLLKSYQHWGEDCVNHFDGMWSFAIWNKKEETLFCSRDRFGEKPFFYFYDGKRFIFGSEIKQLLEYGVPFSVNEKILYRFLKYSFVNLDHETFFENIYHLKPSHNLTINLEGKKLRFNEYRYYQLKKIQIHEKSFEDISQKMGYLLEKSIQRRLRSDVEIGSCLSGGLDSSSIVNLATSQLKKEGYDTSKFNTFTSMYDDFPEVDERYYSDIVVRETNVKNHQVKPNLEELKKDLKDLIWHQEEPFSSFSIYASWMVMKTAKSRQVKVLLDGQGGDETLLGYSRQFTYYLSDDLMKLKLFRFLKKLNLISQKNSLTNFRLFLETIYFNLKTIRSLRNNLKIRKYVNRDFAKSTNDKSIDKIIGNRKIKNNELLDLKYLILPLLRYEDRNAMAHSVETRLPFLNHEFVEYCYSLSAEKKLHQGWSKALLRDYMKNKMNPEVVFRKKKLGFATPDSNWINQIQELNDHSHLIELGFLKSDSMNKLLDKDKNKDIKLKFLIIEIWLQTFTTLF